MGRGLCYSVMGHQILSPCFKTYYTGFVSNRDKPKHAPLLPVLGLGHSLVLPHSRPSSLFPHKLSQPHSQPTPYAVVGTPSSGMTPAGMMRSWSSPSLLLHASHRPQALGALDSAVTLRLDSKLSAFLSGGGGENALQSPTVSTRLTGTFSVSNSATLSWDINSMESLLKCHVLRRLESPVDTAAHIHFCWKGFDFYRIWLYTHPSCAGTLSLVSHLFSTYSGQLEQSRCTSRPFSTNIFTNTYILSFI